MNMAAKSQPSLGRYPLFPGIAAGKGTCITSSLPRKPPPPPPTHTHSLDNSAKTLLGKANEKYCSHDPIRFLSLTASSTGVMGGMPNKDMDRVSETRLGFCHLLLRQPQTSNLNIQFNGRDMLVYCLMDTQKIPRVAWLQALSQKIRPKIRCCTFSEAAAWHKQTG